MQIWDIAHFKSGLWFYYSQSHAIINDLDMVLHGFMLQIIYTTVERLNNLSHCIRLFDSLTLKTMV
jgi:hypothetical protein